MYNKVNLVLMMILINKKFLNPGNFFFLPGFLSWSCTIHRTARERGGYLFNSSLPLPPASQALRHWPGDCCRELTSAYSWQPDSSREPLVSERKSLTTKLHALKSRNNLKNKNNSDPESVVVKKHFNLCLFMKKNRVLNIIAVLVMILLILA